MSSTTLPVFESPSQSRAPARQGYLFGPITDVLGLGGASVFMLVALVALFPNPEDLRPRVAFTMFLVAHVINHPHFAHSYQLFYRGYREKIHPNSEDDLRGRYIWAGIILPAFLATFLLGAYTVGNALLIGFMVNLMGILVGWHYVKQGFGILNVDAVLKKRFFSEREKTLLINNGLATWIFAWMNANRTFKEKDFFGISHYAFGIPDWLFYASAAIMVGFGAVTAYMLLRRAMDPERGLPTAGVIAYLCALYLWTAAIGINPLFALMVPAFHSLQYLLVVWRLQLNIERADETQNAAPRSDSQLGTGPLKRLFFFYLIAAVAGFAGFWALPFILQMFKVGQPNSASPLAAFAVFWLFINIHHYFIDNVIWRKGNRDVGKHLFAHT